VLVVVGSVNADVIVPIQKMPSIGETIVAKDTAEMQAGITVAGGKGANQAVACSRLGVNTRFVCKFGGDANAAMLEKTLEADGVDISQCEKLYDKPSGLGLVLLQQGGTVSCIVCSGANGAWHEDKVQQQCKQLFAKEGEGALSQANNVACVLLQMEVPQFVNEQIAAAATAAGIPVFQDIGGEEREISSAHYRNCLFVSPNKSELKRLSRLPVESDDEIVAAAKSLQAKGARNVLVTLGEEGCLLVTEQGEIVRQAGLKVERVIDETGAGDNFRAAFCVRLFAEKKSIAEALLFASSAAAVSVTKLGAIPSCTTREECLSFMQAISTSQKIADTPRGGSTSSSTKEEENDEFPLQFASRLNSMSDRPELWRGEKNVVGWIKRQGTIKGLDLVDFNYPQHLTSKVSEEEKQKIVDALDEANLKCGAICLRYHKSQFQLGALTNPDPVVRARAIELVNEACEWATALGAKEVVLWSAFCGYDYPLQVEYEKIYDDVVSAFQEVCDKHPQIKVSLEYKPTDENTRFFAIPSTGVSILLAKDVNRDNFGLTLDFGHCLMAGENPAQCVALVAKKLGGDKLFGVQLGDGYSRLGAEDGLVFGSIHPLQSLEFVLYLIKTKFAGHVYFDTFPRNEDPIRECELNIRRFKKMHRFALKMLSKDGGIDLEKVLKQHDAMTMLEFLEEQSAF